MLIWLKLYTPKCFFVKLYASWNNDTLVWSILNTPFFSGIPISEMLSRVAGCLEYNYIFVISVHFPIMKIRRDEIWRMTLMFNYCNRFLNREHATFEHAQVYFQSKEYTYKFKGRVVFSKNILPSFTSVNCDFSFDSCIIL